MWEYARNLPWLTQEIEEIQAYHRARVAAQYDGRRPDGVIAIAGPVFGGNHGLSGSNEIDMLANPEEWLDDVLRDMADRALETANRATFCPLVIELDPLGTHYVDALFDARVCFREGQVWSEQLDGDLAELAAPDLAHSEVFQQSLRLARLASEVSLGRLLVATPVFSCPINIGINLFGERLLEGLLGRPDAARRALRIITDAILACIRTFSKAIPKDIRRTSVAACRYAPAGFGLIDGCAAQLVSARLYQEFFAPLDEELLRAHPRGGMIHLCGACAQHIPTWASMPSLRSVQLNDRAAEDFELFFRGLRSDQILYVQPTQSMPTERILGISKGERVILQSHFNY